MRVAYLATAAAVLFSEGTMAGSRVARMLGVEGGYAVRRDMDKQVRDTIEELDRRQSNSETVQSGASDDSNSSIATACMDTLSGITAITNDAGLAACYNILNMNANDKSFTADLRLYTAAGRKGAFTEVQTDNLMIGVTYPSSTVFTTTSTQRPAKVKRQSISNMTEIQQYTLMGQIDSNIDLQKLNNDQVMSLMVPAITVNAVSEDSRQPITTELTTTDTAYFVVGDFRGEFALSAADPQFQESAIEASAVFVLPGTTFGIFPTGMIITLAWLLIFVCAYGFGTWRRYQHREFYRKRMHIAAGGLKGYQERKGQK